MRNLNSKSFFLVWCLFSFWLVAQPPIPDHIVYGRLGLNCQVIDPDQGIRIEVQKIPSGSILFAYLMGTDELDMSQFVLRIPMSASGQNEETSALPGEEVLIIVLDGDQNVLSSENYVVGESAQFIQLDLGEGESPPQAFAGEDQVLCVNSTMLTAHTPPVGDGLWQIISGENGVLANANDPNTVFSGVMDESYLLEWSITLGECPPTTDTVEISFFEILDLAQAGPDLTSCFTDVQLSANVPQYGSGTWRIIQGASGSFSSINDPLAIFHGEAGRTYVLEWSIGNGVCDDSSDQMTLEIVPLIGEPMSITGPELLSCNEIAYLTASEGFESYLWSTGENTRGIYVSNLGLETYSVVGTTRNGCQTNAVHQVEFLPGDLEVAVFTGPTEYTICSLSESYVLDALGLCGAGEPYTYEWTLMEGDGLIDDPNSSPTLLHAYQNGSYVVGLNVVDRVGTFYDTTLDLYAPVLEDFDMNGIINELDWLLRISFWASNPGDSPFFLDIDQSGNISILDFFITQPCELSD